MIKAVIAGLTTVAGVFLASWAVYYDVRLDWPETAIVFGVALFMAGTVQAWEMIKRITEGGE